MRVCAVIVPLVTILPVTCSVLFTKFKLVEAVAAFTLPSESNTLPGPGLLMVLNPVPLDPEEPELPEEPDEP